MSWFKFEGLHDPNAPSRRECHTVCTSGERLVVYGGNDDLGRHSSVHILDTVAMSWERVDSEDPGRRSAHTSVLSPDEKWMYVFAGWNGADELGDVMRFNIEDRKWERVPTTGTPPSPRHFHMSTRVGNCMCVDVVVVWVASLWILPFSTRQLLFSSWSPFPYRFLPYFYTSNLFF